MLNMLLKDIEKLVLVSQEITVSDPKRASGWLTYKYSHFYWVGQKVCFFP